MKLKTIDEAYDYIYSFINLESKLHSADRVRDEYSLDNIRKILEFFDNPQSNKKIFHVAGTKGKGSVTMMISRLLNLAGYSACSFMSPHLIKPNERILYDLTPMPDDVFIEYTGIVKDVIEKNSLKPTTFEFFFIMFLLYANDKKAD